MERLTKLVQALDSKHVTDLVVIDMRKHSPLYDFMIVSTAPNPRIISGVLTELKAISKEPNFELKFIEGHNSGEWVLADFKHVIVHVFTQEMRDKYNLERLWKDADRISTEGMI